MVWLLVCLEDDNLVVLAVRHEQVLEVAAAGRQHHLDICRLRIRPEQVTLLSLYCVYCTGIPIRYLQ